MLTVFLSYSRADLPLIEQLEACLQASVPDISIWRDQEKIYGGQKWPKVLGEAIADQDVFLLAWSKNSKASHFVEFEWCTAIALKKTIVPCLLDETPLALSLRTFHGHRLNDATGLITSLLAAPLGHTERRESVIRKLSDITVTEETAVLAQAKTMFAQQHWTVQGNVYQAAGDIHIHHESSTLNAPGKAKPLVEKWQAWTGLTLTVGILIGGWFLMEWVRPIQAPSAPEIASEVAKHLNNTSNETTFHIEPPLVIRGAEFAFGHNGTTSPIDIALHVQVVNTGKRLLKIAGYSVQASMSQNGPWKTLMRIPVKNGKLFWFPGGLKDAWVMQHIGDLYEVLRDSFNPGETKEGWEFYERKDIKPLDVRFLRFSVHDTSGTEATQVINLENRQNRVQTNFHNSGLKAIERIDLSQVQFKYYYSTYPD